MKLGYHELRPTDAGVESFQSFFDWFEKNLYDETVDNHDLVCETLFVLQYARMDYKAHLKEARSNGDAGLELSLLQLDPRNAALEPEYYEDKDLEKYARNKPILWLWTAFDRLPLARNTLFAFPFRRLMGKFLFKYLGENVKLFHGIELTYGYNLVIEDDVVIHREVMLDDRGGITIRKGASVSDFANIYSHTHDVEDIRDVTMHHTIIGENARVTYHSTVLSGASMGDWSILGAMGLATKKISDKEVKGGIPARPITRILRS